PMPSVSLHIGLVPSLDRAFCFLSSLWNQLPKIPGFGNARILDTARTRRRHMRRELSAWRTRRSKRRRGTAAGLLVLALLSAGCSMTPPGAAKENDDAAVTSKRGKPVIGVSAIDLTSSFFVG